MAYLIKRGCSTRVKPDPKCPDFINYRPGDIVQDFPAHVPVDQWIASGHIVLVGEAPSRKDKGK